MRESKFRAWDKKEKRWFGYENPNQFVCVSNELVVYIEYMPCANGSWQPKYCRQLTWNEIKNIEITECTGLKDKNGKEIYEGDLLVYYRKPYVVMFENGRFFGKAENNNVLVLANVGKCINQRAIGNIYENPELLKKGE